MQRNIVLLPLSNIGIMIFWKKLLISFYMSQINQIFWFFNLFLRHSILLKHREFFNFKLKLKYFHKIAVFVLKNYLTILLDLARYTLFCDSLTICPLIMKLIDSFPKFIWDQEVFQNLKDLLHCQLLFSWCPKKEFFSASRKYCNVFSEGKFS